MTTSMNGFLEATATLKAADGLAVGQAVKISANQTAAPCAAGNVPCGVCNELRGGYAGVQLAGYAKLSYSGTAPAVGYTQLAADGNGGVKAASSGGKFYTVLEVDSAKSTLGLILY